LHQGIFGSGKVIYISETSTTRLACTCTMQDNSECSQGWTPPMVFLFLRMETALGNRKYSWNFSL